MRTTDFCPRTRVTIAALVVSTWLFGCQGSWSWPGSADGGPSAIDPVTSDATEQSGYVTFDPNGPAGGHSGAMDASSSDAGMAAGRDAGSSVDAGSGSEVERAIAEADIVHVAGDRLYALSEYRGLLIVDVSDPDQLRLLGRFRTSGRPFEMYLVDGMAYVMFTSFWTYVADADGYSSWQQSSRLAVLDVTDPASVRQVTSFDLGGEISDSRLVGSILYTVAYENGYCYHCDDTAQTAITAIAIGDLANIHVVDRLAFPVEGYSWGPRSVSVTGERMYVAGEQWRDDGSAHSAIQVVDIADPTGRLVLGASVEVAGQIQSRWQINERNGVLRVISQPSSWSSAQVPVVETFAVASASAVTPLGRLDLVLPRPEQLQSVQFDGDRGYAVTFQRTDPLFVIDLSDPAHPQQRGQLEMPGWLYHMVPQGDRMLAIGFADQSRQLAVSLFDVSDVAAPALLSRVEFGGSWAAMPEDQDRIHKAFTILPELGLILMPYSGWSATGYQSGIQLIDRVGDTLIERGVAPHRGQARRALIVGGRLLALSDERLDSFDIADRDRPQRTSTLQLARTVYRAVKAGAVVAELVGDWWSHEARLDLLPAFDPDRPQPLGSIDLSTLRPDDADPYDYWYYGFPYYSARLFAVGDTVYLLWGDSYYYGSTGSSRLAAIDIADPAAPRLVADQQLPLDLPYGYGWYGDGGGAVAGAQRLVQVGAAIGVLQGGHGTYDYSSGQWVEQPASVQVIDLADPQHVVSREVMLPEGEGATGLLAAGSAICTAHSERLRSDPRYVRVYLDRIDVANPAAPALLPPVNIPGRLAAIDAASGLLVTVEDVGHPLAVDSWDACYQQADSSRYQYDAETGRCWRISQRIDLLTLVGNQARLDHQVELGADQAWQFFAQPDRVRAMLPARYAYDRATAPRLLTLQRAGRSWSSASAELPGYYPVLLDVAGSTVALVENDPPAVVLLDAADPGTLRVLARRSLPGYSYASSVVDGSVLSVCGPWGVAITPLDGSAANLAQ